MRKPLVALAALILAAFCAVSGMAQAGQSFLQREFFASDFGQWRINSQTANTFQWYPGSICTISAGGINFFAFNTNAPLFIVDSTASLNEVVTPSATSTTATTCSVTVAPSNTHTQFSLTSGTGGLQEALNQVSSSNAYPVNVILDRNWYTLASAVVGKTPQGIIAAAAGNSQAILVDRTTAPYTFYIWNGTKYTASGSTAGSFNLAVSSNTNVAAPTALTTVGATCATNGGGCITSTTTGGTVPANGAAYTMGATCVDASGGETTLSIDTAGGATVTPSGSASTSTISVTSPAGCTAANGAIGWRLYMSAAAGGTLSEILYTPTCTAPPAALQNFLPSTCAIGSTATITAVVTGTATIPTVNTAYPRLPSSSGSYPPFPALGTVAAAATGTLGTINFPAGYLNTLGRQITVCGNGYATTNSTAGTLTLAATLASIPGVTSITPFTAVSGSTAASAQADPFDFCITFTTSVTGSSGKVETHGWVLYSLAGTAPGTAAVDIVITNGSAVDLTKQDQLAFTIKPTTTALTAAQLRQLSVVSSQ